MITRLSGCRPQLLLFAFRSCPIQPLLVSGVKGRRVFANRALDLDLSKEFVRDTILYQTNNLPRLRRFQLAALINFLMWGYFGNFVLQHVGSISVEQEKRMILEKDPSKRDTTGFSFWEKLSLTERKYHTYLAILFSLVGYLTALSIGFFSVRSVNTMIVKRGGADVTILTSRMVSISKLREITVPLTHVSCVTSRETASAYMTIKIKGHRFYFLVDTRGTFYNQYLFDRTFGVQRNLSKLQ